MPAMELIRPIATTAGLKSGKEEIRRRSESPRRMGRLGGTPAPARERAPDLLALDPRDD